MKTRFKSTKADRLRDSQNPRMEFLAELMDDRWAPHVDVGETPESIVVVAELAGVKPGDVTVEVRGRELRLFGRRGSPEPGAETFAPEIPEGTFSRSVELPADVDASRRTVHMHDGLLRVDLPKVA